MKVIQAILSAFWLVTLVHGVAGLGGGAGIRAAAAHLDGHFSLSPPVSIPTDFGIGDILKTIFDLIPTPTGTEAVATPVETAVSTEATVNTAVNTYPADTPTAITHDVNTPTAVTHDANTPTATTYDVNTPIASETVDVWVITTVSAYVTICPTPTTFTQGVQTYTIVTATTLTITNCPCTISYPSPPTVATNPPTVASVPVPVGTGLTPSGNPIVVTNNTIIPSVPVANPPAPVSFNTTRTTFIAGTAPPPHATQPLITLGGSTPIIPTPVPETPIPVPNTPVQPTPTPATGGADRVFIGLGAAFLSGIVAVFL
ncbi:hypothetical protein V492_04403 [Pseudogymnoascus sp. VKM F-4246]|nr:hypothetical protein V492_04403 [Pseudogymnoascus sp. VKM F-4246]